MALKRKIDKAAFDALSADIKKEYKKNGSSDDYILDTEGDDDKTTQLQKALDNEREELKKLKKDAADAAKAQQDEKDRVELETKKKAGDFDAIEKDYKQKLADKDNIIAGMTTKHKDQLRDVLVNSAADALAAKISTTPDLVRPIIAARLTVDDSGTAPITRVLGTDGRPSAMTVEELGGELAKDPKYKAVMIASKANGGGGAPPGQNRGGTAGMRLPNPQNGPDGKAPLLATLSPKQLAQAMQDRKAQQAADTGV